MRCHDSSILERRSWVRRSAHWSDLCIGFDRSRACDPHVLANAGFVVAYDEYTCLELSLRNSILTHFCASFWFLEQDDQRKLACVLSWHVLLQLQGGIQAWMPSCEAGFPDHMLLPSVCVCVCARRAPFTITPNWI